MKQAIILLLLVSICSCTTHLAVYELDSKTVKLNSDSYEFENEHLIIQYHLWEVGGILDFNIYNKTDKPIYIDWKNSNFIRMGKSIDYWQDQELSVEESRSTINKNWDISTAGFSIKNKEKPSIQLPPKSYTSIDRFYLDYPNDASPVRGKNKIITESYLESASPFNFRNFISYSFSKELENPMFVDNDFWVSKKFKMALKTYDNNFKNEMGSRNNKFYNEIQKSTLIFFILGGAVVAAIVALQ